MSTQTHRDSTTDTAITRALLAFATAEANAIRALNSGFPINVLRNERSDTTDPLLTPLEIEGLRWTAKFGWLRWWMLARLMWSASPATSARTLAMRMIRGLSEKHLIYPVIGGDGYEVFLLAERGAAYLRTYFPDLYARDVDVGRRGLTAGTRQTSPTGPTFMHRLISNAYLAEAVANGRSVATEYEQLVDTEEWRAGWHRVGYRAKRADGLTAIAGEMSDDHGALLLDIEVIETLRNRPKISLTLGTAGGPIVQDDMGRLLISLREHSANGQRVTLVLTDDRSGHGIAQTLVRYATLRGIQVSPECVQFAFVPVRPGAPIFGPFRRTAWPRNTRTAFAPSAAAVSSGNVSKSAAPIVRQPDFRLVLDKRFPNGDREAVIQHLPTAITAQASTCGTLNHGYMEFGLFDPEGEPLFLDVVVREDSLDLSDPDQFRDLCDELRMIIPDDDCDD